MENDFEGIRLKLASFDQIHEWSHGEVMKPETINYRTQKPEMDGLFCERIFGPVKDWECYCGKYKRIRYKGVVCDKCGVEVTRSVVRRERMGHIDLAVPVSHIWFLRGVPSKIGLVLDLSVQNLEKVIYFASYIITRVDEEAKKESEKQIESEYKVRRKEIERAFQQVMDAINLKKQEDLASGKAELAAKADEKAAAQIALKEDEKTRELDELAEAVDIAKKELKDIKKLRIISELQYRDYSIKYGKVFDARIGAEAIFDILKEVDLDKKIAFLNAHTKDATPSKQKRMVRRLKLFQDMKRANLRPEWMMITALPVIPPDLRPMVQLDGGRFASSDLNDLYRRVINRNNRLRRLMELNAPEVICRNEKRMLQEAVDALIDNSARRGKAVASATGQKRTLKSLSDMLKGKQGRFRQNLLGKRVDYSGRSVIVVGPNLKLDECGIPKTMALELFKPFVIGELIKRELAHNVRSASKLIEAGVPEVWDILELVTKGSYVLLNRAPTLHRLGIQAFKPILIEGKAIQIHPLVCEAFNADFDGDQMAVHVPLTEPARKEAAEIMLSTHNLLKPAAGEPVTAARHDMVLGCYYMTQMADTPDSEVKYFSDATEVALAYDSGAVKLNHRIKLKINDVMTETTPGRVIFNQILPEKLRFINKVLDKKELKNLVSRALDMFDEETTADLIDKIKNIGFKYVTRSGLSWAMSDLKTLDAQKTELLLQGDDEVNKIYKQFKMGLLTDDERYTKVIEVWKRIRDQVAKIAVSALDKHSSVRYMIESGARGSMEQLSQMLGMRGLMISPSGNTIELPVKGNFKEGLDVLEYFISTHGARKGLSDTAIRTANAGYLTRRLVDVSQDVVITEESCSDTKGMRITQVESRIMGEELVTRIIGRTLAEDIKDPATGKVVAKKGTLVTKEISKQLEAVPFDSVAIFTVLTCKTRRGLCQKCYGFDLGYNKLVRRGQAVGIVAAQAIGEPGTQLTMRTFHTGGVASAGDITQGLPRVAELFEARSIKKPAFIAELDGKVKIITLADETKVLKILSDTVASEAIALPLEDNLNTQVKTGDVVKQGDVLFLDKEGAKYEAPLAGIVKFHKDKVVVTSEGAAEKEYPLTADKGLLVKDGDLVVKGQPLTEGHLDLRLLFKLKGKEAVQKYVVREVQHIYSTQGQKVSDKHLEIIVRQMMSVVTITEQGETDLLPDEFVSRARFLEVNDLAEKEGHKPAKSEDMLLGITKASLNTDSFLSAASFQETVRVLIDASISSRMDGLRGIKENVIIGKLIPAGTGFDERERVAAELAAAAVAAEK